MADYRPRAPLPGDDESGYDVWLPALVALIAAIVMVVMARADEPAAAAPRAIYESRHFDEGAADREAAATAVARGDYADMADAPAEPRRRLTVGHVVVAALPVIEPAAVVVSADPEAEAVAVAAVKTVHVAPAVAPAADHIGKALAILGIAALLAGTLVLLHRTWRRTSVPIRA